MPLIKLALRYAVTAVAEMGGCHLAWLALAGMAVIGQQPAS